MQIYLELLHNFVLKKMVATLVAFDCIFLLNIKDHNTTTTMSELKPSFKKKRVN
jgi:hypothetical protein